MYLQDQKQKEWDPKPALEFLLKEQREDGSWLGYKQPKDDQSHPMSIATTALVCMTLLEHLDTNAEKIKPMLEKASRPA